MSLEYVSVASLSDVPPGEVMGVNPAVGYHIVLCNVNGDIYAVDDACSHAGGMLQFGELIGELIRCPLHSAEFDVKTGDAVESPAKEPLSTHPVRVIDGQIEVGIEF